MSWRSKVPAYYFLLHPVSSVLFVYTLLRSMSLTLWNDGITWRGTKYPLEEFVASVAEEFAGGVNLRTCIYLAGILGWRSENSDSALPYSSGTKSRRVRCFGDV